MQKSFLAGAVVGLVCGLLALFLAGYALGNLQSTVDTFTRNATLVKAVAGYVTLAIGFGAWVIKTFDTTGGFFRMTASETAAPAALTLTGAILLAL
jgi:hypothetical protein